jgi:NAD(P)-dependent dehydrogenase (short-subunit alcohol dehydrogenase family)
VWFKREGSSLAGSLERRRGVKWYLTVPGDISQPETGQSFVAKTVEAFGRLDVFVSNAGVCQFAEFLE